MTLSVLAVCIMLGIIPLLWLPVLPNIHSVWYIITGGCLMACMQPRFLRYGGITLLIFAWGVLAATQTLWPTVHLPGANRQTEVVITDTDNMTRHQAKIVRLNGKRLLPAPGVVLYGQYLPASVCTGQRWAMTVRIRAIHGQLNDGGFDSQRYALANQLPLSGRFSDARLLKSTCSWRADYLQSLTHTLSMYVWRPVILGLGMGERAALDSQVKEIMRQTGTAHLMAISGLHIALAALLGGLIIRGIQFCFPAHWINWRLPLLVGVICAVGYAWLTGLQPPALRTAISLSVWALLRLSGRLWSPWDVWLCCVAAILFIDPLSVLSYSLWLSAFAVAALLFWYQWLPAPAQERHWLIRNGINLIHLQIGMTLLLTPMQLSMFHGITLSSLLANLIAIPLVTFVAVPLILAGMLLHLTGPPLAEEICWYLADKTLALLFSFLR